MISLTLCTVVSGMSAQAAGQPRMVPVCRIIARQFIPAAVVAILVITINDVMFGADIMDFPVNNAAMRTVAAFGTGDTSCNGGCRTHEQAHTHHSRQ